jgi:hypothetical protein
MAGIFDLKARISYKNNHQRRTRQVIAYVETKEIAVIRELSRLTGTNVEMRTKKALSEFIRRGCVEHCPEPHVHVDAEGLYMPSMARWTITGAGMVVVLYNLQPLMHVDRGFPEAVAEVLQNQRLEGQGATMQINTIKRLSDLGWSLPPEYRHLGFGPQLSRISSRVEVISHEVHIVSQEGLGGNGTHVPYRQGRALVGA